MYPVIQNLSLGERIKFGEKRLKERKNILKLQENKIKSFMELRECERKKDLEFQEREEKLIYSSSGEFLYFILENIKNVGLDINLMGREVYTSIDNKRNKVLVHIEMSGTENGIYRFLEVLEKDNKYSTLMKQGLLIKYENNCTNLKGNFMYIIKNKTEKERKFVRKKGKKLKSVKRKEENSFGKGNYLRMGTRRRMI